MGEGTVAGDEGLEALSLARSNRICQAELQRLLQKSVEATSQSDQAVLTISRLHMGLTRFYVQQ